MWHPSGTCGSAELRQSESSRCEEPRPNLASLSYNPSKMHHPSSTYILTAPEGDEMNVFPIPEGSTLLIRHDDDKPRTVIGHGGLHHLLTGFEKLDGIGR
jgi:hypothetical protein